MIGGRRTRKGMMAGLATATATVAVIAAVAWAPRLRAADAGSAAAKPAAAPAKPTAAATAPATPAAPVDPAAAAAARAAVLRKKVLKDEDFVENEESNRDPFHSYLRLFVDKLTIKTRKVPAIFDKYSLEELALIAVISGDENPRAMFRDPLGLGQTVKQGDYISKSGARVTKILSDRVIVEQTETGQNGESRGVEKAILVNPEEPSR
ncbi:MAG: type pilus assembly protein PilP [Myxococcales bacterium]|jgi:Tfp pilus assembly protein PilP|nr:type pilus assembly protein PilP [Myxococcales bacterium]